MIDPLMLENFCRWIRERESIRNKRAAGFKAPWTYNSIMQQFHFCNVRREDDRGTKELRAVVKEIGPRIEDLPWVYTAARLFNSAATLRPYLLGGVEAVKQRREKGLTVFNVAYVVSTCGKRVDKVDYVHSVVQAVHHTNVPNMSCRHAFNALRSVDGLGSFLAGQIVADLKNDRYLQGVDDWETFSVMGPGSKKGLDFLFGQGTTENTYDLRIAVLSANLPPDIKNMKIHRQDLQNCLCEFSKYVRYLDNLPGRRRPYHVHS